MFAGRAAMLAAALVLVAACGGAADPPTPAPTPTPTASPATPTPTTVATPAPTEAATGWWEDDAATPDATRPDSRIWNVRAEQIAPGETALSFDYFLSLAPEANVFVHMGLYPDVTVTLLDAAEEPLGSAAGDLRPTEFGDDTVGGAARFAMPAARFADIVAARICIRVVTGDSSAFMGRPELLCEPFPVERVEP